MPFLEGSALSNAIYEIAAERGARCAVAFWGAGAYPFVGPEGKIICNLKSGATNPYVIERFDKKSVRQLDTLHAKVYIGGRHAVVTSANFSANGLGLERLEQANWVEAGFLTDDVKPIAAWFDALWTGSREISPDDIEAAKLIWASRQRAKPTLNSFGDFDPESELIPHVDWVGDGHLEIDEESVKAQNDGVYDDNIYRRITRGVVVNDKADLEYLTSGRWLLRWYAGSNQLPKTRPSPYWTYLEGFFSSAAIVDGQIYDIALQADKPPPEPFSVENRNFLTAFYSAISSDQFTGLRGWQFEKAWYQQTVPLLRPFWRQVKKQYENLQRTKKVDPTLGFEKIIIFPIHNALKEGRDIYEATRRAWTSSPVLTAGAIAIGLDHGISLGAFRISNWRKAKPGSAKMAFDGKPLLDNRLVGRNWTRITTAAGGFWQRGGYLVIEFDGVSRFRFLRGSRNKHWQNLEAIDAKAEAAAAGGPLKSHT